MGRALSKEKVVEIDSNLTKEFQKGAEARKFVNNPLWKEALNDLETMYLDAIKSNTWLDKLDKNKRDEACRRIQVLDDLKQHFENTITKGEEAKTRLEAKKNGSK